MNIDDKILNQIETLAKLNIGAEDKKLTIKKIQGVLDVLDKIDSSDIADLEPLYHPLQIQQPMRADISNPDIDRTHLQNQAPKVEAGLFLVPQVIE